LEITNHVFLRHLPSRWLTLEQVTERLIEQLPALKKFFLSVCPANNESAQRIRQILRNKVLLAEMYFLKSIMAVFTKVTHLFQCEAPLIHILHDELSTLVLTLLRRFVKPDVIGEKHGAQLYDIEFKNSDFQIKFPDLGHDSKAHLKELLSENKISKDEYLSNYLYFGYGISSERCVCQRFQQNKCCKHSPGEVRGIEKDCRRK